MYTVATVLDLLEAATKNMVQPMSIRLIKDFGRDPFLVLIACLLSLRARDVAVYPVCHTLFTRIKTPQEFLDFPLYDLEIILKPIGFYRKKAQVLKCVSAELLEKFGGKVPGNEADLLSLPGVGRKTANLVLAEGFGIPALCVDTHVHKIANRLGLVSTKTPEATEAALQKIVPQERWRDVNRLFVMWGQNICVPVSPRCSVCVLAPMCPRVGVTKSR